MYMTDSEISVMYRQAKNPEEQVQILADLNGCRKRDMEIKLSELGLREPPEEKPTQHAEDRMPVWVRIDGEEIRSLYEQGLTDIAIAKALGHSLYAVERWRKDKRLPRNGVDRKAVADDAAAMELYLAGTSDGDMAQILGRSLTAVRSWRSAKGLARNPGRTSRIDEAKALELYYGGATDKEMAEAFGVNSSTMQKWRNSMGLPSAREVKRAAQPKEPKVRRQLDEAKALELYHGGSTDKEIAAATGFASSTIRRWRSVNGLPVLPKPKPQTPPKVKEPYRPPFDEDLARECYLAGLNDAEMANHLGCSRGAVVYWRKKQDLPPVGIKGRPSRIDEEKGREMFLAGATDQEMAEAFGVSRKRICQWRLARQLSRPRGGERKAKTEKLVLRGMLGNRPVKITIEIGVENHGL